MGRVSVVYHVLKQGNKGEKNRGRTEQWKREQGDKGTRNNRTREKVNKGTKEQSTQHLGELIRKHLYIICGEENSPKYSQKAFQRSTKEPEAQMYGQLWDLLGWAGSLHAMQSFARNSLFNYHYTNLKIMTWSHRNVIRPYR